MPKPIIYFLVLVLIGVEVVYGGKNTEPMEFHDMENPESAFIVKPKRRYEVSTRSPISKSTMGYYTSQDSDGNTGNDNGYYKSYNTLGLSEPTARDYVTTNSKHVYDAPADSETSPGHRHSYGWRGWRQEHLKHDENGLGLLTLLSLLSLLQGVLSSLVRLFTTTTTMAPMMMMNPPLGRSRPKRSVLIYRRGYSTNGESMTERITRLVLPSLNVIAQARNGKIPLRCTSHEVCILNQILRAELGILHGKLVGEKLQAGIWELLNEMEENQTLVSQLGSAMTAGHNRTNCQVSYPICLEMKGLTTGSIKHPPILLDLGTRHSSFKNSLTN